MIADFVLPPLAALLLWWGGTGLVLLLDRQPRGAARGTFALATLAAALAVAAIARTAADGGTAAAYAAFTAAVVLWAWHELAFLGGWLTGPRRIAASPGAAGWTRLGQAIGVLLWHEIALLATGAALWLGLHGQPNPTAAWAFTLLYGMRVSAKLNLYLGVRNLALDFLPPHLLYLGSYFRQRRFNRLMPWSLLAGVAMVAVLLVAAAHTGAGERAAHMLLASMLLLAVVEHLMMVAPVDPSALWRWALRREPA